MSKKVPYRAGVVQRDLSFIRVSAGTVPAAAIRVQKDLVEAQSAGLLALRSRTGAPVSGGSVSDTTAVSAGSYEFHRFHGSLAEYVAFKVEKARKHQAAASKALEDAIGAIYGAWLDTDPDLGRDRREKRAAAKEAANRVVANNNGVSYHPARQAQDPTGKQPWRG